MTEKTSALLVHQNSETLRALKRALESLGVGVSQAGTRAEAKRMLGGVNPAPLVFTDVQVPDGTWADILTVAEKVLLPVNVIVVARLGDVRFYVEVIEAGAYDFIAPPFNATDLAYVIRSAMDNVIARRAAQPRREPSAEDGLVA
jgi:DNA-binding NtrC family response regulator